MKLAGRTALVTGAAGGIGRALVQALLDAGVGRVVATVRELPPHAPSDPRLHYAALDLADPASVAALAQAHAAGAELLVNNAGLNGNGALFDAGAEALARREMEVNYFGLLRMLRAFGPAMAARGDGMVVNLLSFTALNGMPALASYAASKAAAHALTLAARAELAPRGVRVLGVYPRAVATAMTAHLAIPKMAPAELADALLQAVAAGRDTLFPGPALPAYRALLAEQQAAAG